MKNKSIHVLLLLLLLSCDSDAPNTPAAMAQEVRLVNAFPNLVFSRPVFLTHSPDGSNRIFVVEQRGVIQVFPNDSTASETEPFLDIRDRVNDGASEMGLLGLAFHPDFASNGFLYVNYTTTSNGPRRSIVSRFTASGNRADPGSEQILLEIAQPFTNHNGGMLAFGPDGFLYLSFGDGGLAADPEENGQDKTTLLGSILRLDVDNTDPGLNYAIPPDNPFVGEGGGVRQEIFAYGLRNPWRFSIDQQTAEIWCGDVGQEQWEEIDRIESGGNYGWDVMEGPDCFEPANCDPAGLELPIVAYDHSGGKCSVTGGYVYRGAIRPELRGAYLYGDFCSGEIWLLRDENGQRAADSLLVDSDFNISSFGVDEQDELYILDLAGTIHRFAGSPATRVATPARAPGHFSLVQNYPNPFNPSTRIRYFIPKAGLVELTIFNSLAQQIKTLFRSVQPPGNYEITWDGRDNNGGLVSSGIYVVQLTSGGLVQRLKMTLAK